MNFVTKPPRKHVPKQATWISREYHVNLTWKSRETHPSLSGQELPPMAAEFPTLFGFSIDVMCEVD